MKPIIGLRTLLSLSFFLTPLLLSANSSDVQAWFTDEYPLVAYGVGSVHDFPQVKEMGFTHVYASGRGFAGDPANEERMQWLQEYLDEAERNGLKVMFCLDGHRRIPRGDVGLQQMQAIVQRFKNHPAVGFWYLYDEPNLPSARSRRSVAAQLQEEDTTSTPDIVRELRRSPDLLLPYYQMVKKETPDVPVMVLMAVTDTGWWRDSWQEFEKTFDITSFDIYPVYSQEFPESSLQRVTAWTDEYMRKTNKMVLPCVQIFNWNTIERRVERNIEQGRDDYKYWRIPNHQELRFWNFSSLIQGAPGMIYYSYAEQRRGSDEWVEQDLKPATLEFRAFTDLVQSMERTELLPYDESHPLMIAQWRGENRLFIVMANASAHSQSFEWQAPDSLSNTTWTPWAFSRNDALQPSSTLNISMNPWEVLIWEIQ